MKNILALSLLTCVTVILSMPAAMAQYHRTSGAAANGYAYPAGTFAASPQNNLSGLTGALPNNRSRYYNNNANGTINGTGYNNGSRQQYGYQNTPNNRTQNYNQQRYNGNGNSQAYHQGYQAGQRRSIYRDLPAQQRPYTLTPTSQNLSPQ